MKFLLSLCVSVLTAAVLLNVLPVHGEEAVYRDTIRLHVIAESDSEEDQALKLKVRDCVLEGLEDKLADVTGTEKAAEIISSSLEELEESAANVLKSNGCDSSVSVEFGSEEYPIRYYDGFTLPSGTYRSLRVIIGDGDGKNWWCILFPSVCIADALAAEDEYIEAGFTPEQYRIIDNSSPKRYKVRFKILEILSDIVGIDY